MITKVFLFAFLLRSASVLASKFYITKNPNPQSCSHSHLQCLTLNEFASIIFTNNVTLTLESEKHPLNTELQISNLNALIIKTNSSMTKQTEVVCGNSVMFTFVNISYVEIQGINFCGCAENHIIMVEYLILQYTNFTGQNKSGRALYLEFVTTADVASCSFFSNTNHSQSTNSAKNKETGGAIMVTSSSLTVTNTTFSHNSAGLDHGGALSFYNSTVLIFYTTFSNNSAQRNGGTIYANFTNIQILNSRVKDNCFYSLRSKANKTALCCGAIYGENSSLLIQNTFFIRNRANGSASSSNSSNRKHDQCTDRQCGGAIHITSNSRLEVLNCTFDNNRAQHRGGAIYSDESQVNISDSVFTNNRANYGGAIDCNGSIHIVNSNFGINKADKQSGGAIKLTNSFNTSVFNSTFMGNEARLYGGAIYAIDYSSLTINITECQFHNNNGTKSGGAVFLKVIPLKIKKNKPDGMSMNSLFTNSNFTNNSAREYGSTIVAISCNLITDGLNIANSTGDVNTVFVINGKVTFAGRTSVINNSGSVFAFNSDMKFTNSTLFKDNGVLYCDKLSSQQSFREAFVQEGGAITGIQSTISFKGETLFEHNCAIKGGAIKVTELSKVFFNSQTLLMNNKALTHGGGIYAYQSELNFGSKGAISITNNCALNRGGGIDATISAIKLSEGSLFFTNNNATHGGGLSLSLYAKLYVLKLRAECKTAINYVCHTTANPQCKRLILQFANNTADYGGAIYVNDSQMINTCQSRFNQSATKALNECFMQTLALYSYGNHSINNLHFINTYFLNNTAKIAGSNIFGGLLDRCTMSILNEMRFALKKRNVSHSNKAISHILNVTNITDTDTIASDAVRVWFCRNNQPDPHYQLETIEVAKGQIFFVSVVAVDQVDHIVSPAYIHSSVSSNSGQLKEGQTHQMINSTSCSRLQFNVFSKQMSESISLYASGPCNGTGISLRIIKVQFGPCVILCPIGFQPSSKKNETNDCICECDSSLSPFIKQCFITNGTLLRKGEFWMTYYNDYSNKPGFVKYSYCPYDFCKPAGDKIYINLNISNGADAQCAFNRSGVLCGSCEEGLSLILGSSRCLQCSNNKIVLIIPFAIAGIVLVIFLLVCNLTVAVGTLNGLIFYANIVIANRSLFFPFKKPNIITVFIAWLNLDLGMETCFYNGMDAYAKIWLQFVFPLYLILLVVIVIIVSEKSSRFAKLLAGRNPVATLVTVILLSYTKLLRTIIYVLAIANLNYPDSVHTVWLFDGNVDYLKGKHIPLFIAAVTIIIIGLVFTFILFSWQWILQLSDKVRALKWITTPKLNSVMDAYHAPFNPKHRFWSGLLLFVRIMLYVLSAGNINGDSRASLVIINIAMTCLIVFKLWFGNRMYKKWILNILEDVFIINIIIFAVATKYMKNNNLSSAQIILGYTSTSVAQSIFCGILVYHTFAFVVDKAFTKKLCYYLQQCQRKFATLSKDKEEYDTQLEQLMGKPSSADYRLAEISSSEQSVTTTVVTMDNVGSDKHAETCS